MGLFPRGRVLGQSCLLRVSLLCVLLLFVAVLCCAVCCPVVCCFFVVLFVLLLLLCCVVVVVVAIKTPTDPCKIRGSRNTVCWVGSWVWS